MTILLASCAPVDLNAPMPTFDTGVDPNAWAQIPAGEFYFGQHEDVKSTDSLRNHGHRCDRRTICGLPQRRPCGWHTQSRRRSVVGYYPGDEFRGVKHELEIKAGDWDFVPLARPVAESQIRWHPVHGSGWIRESPDDHGYLVRRVGLLRVL